MRRKVHDNLAITQDYSIDDKVKVLMTIYIDNIVKEFLMTLWNNVKCPWFENLFKVNQDAEKLNSHKKELFYTFIMKLMFLCKCARPDVSLAICFLSSRVREDIKQDIIKLIQLLSFLLMTQLDPLTLKADDHSNLY